MFLLEVEHSSNKSTSRKREPVDCKYGEAFEISHNLHEDVSVHCKEEFSNPKIIHQPWSSKFDAVCKNEEFNLNYSHQLLSSTFCGQNEFNEKFDSKFSLQQCLTLFLCDICGETFNMQSQLEKHIFTHDRQRIFSCDECNEIFKFKTELKRHILSLHHKKEEKSFCCEICHKIFKQRAHLKDHSVSHSKDRPFECSICHRTYKRKAALNRHSTIIHGRSRKFDCDGCSKQFKGKLSLRRHVINGSCAGTVYNPGKFDNKEIKQEIQVTLDADTCVPTTQKRSISCRECGCIFDCKNEFWTHMLHHIDEFQSNSTETHIEMPQLCQSEQEQYGDQLSCTIPDEPSSLLVNTPSNEAKFEMDNEFDSTVNCPACFETFTQYCLLIEHAETCEKYSSFVSIEERKMVQSLEEPEFCCGFCSLPFDYPTFLAEHLREVHNVNLILHWCIKYGCESFMKMS